MIRIQSFMFSSGKKLGLATHRKRTVFPSRISTTWQPYSMCIRQHSPSAFHFVKEVTYETTTVIAPSGVTNVGEAKENACVILSSVNGSDWRHPRDEKRTNGEVKQLSYYHQCHSTPPKPTLQITVSLSSNVSRLGSRCYQSFLWIQIQTNRMIVD